MNINGKTVNWKDDTHYYNACYVPKKGWTWGRPITTSKNERK